MTGAEWQACDVPALLLREIRRSGRDRRKGGPRKLRLVAAANCRTLEAHFGGDPIVLTQVGLAERMADGQVRPDTVPDYRPKGAATDKGLLSQNVFYAAWSATAANPATAARLSAEYAQIAHAYVPKGDDWTYDRVWRLEAQLIRDIFGNPFRPVAFDPAWRTATVVALARGIYDDRAFDRLPILADALQDAGCDNDDILNHCRHDTVHARGCWVVDLVLGKA